MTKKFVRFACCFIPSRRVRHYLRNRYIKKKGFTDWTSNHIWLIAPDGTRRSVRRVPNCKFTIRGTNNNIFLYEPIDKLKLECFLNDNSNITIYPVCNWGAQIYVWRGYGDSKVVNLNIDAGLSTTGKLEIKFTHGGGGDITIGRDCMFSWGCSIHNGDYHTIIEKKKKKILNYNQPVTIGNHVWVGCGTVFWKGASVADNSVVGTRSLVTHKFNEPNVVIAGTPAKIVKRGIDWDRRSIEQYESEELLV
ncbi:acyltransferase [bacterium]|nr:acyltransferase [bacterium]